MKINCPKHEDSTPSMHVYANGEEVVGFCFVCSARMVLDEKLLPSGTPTVHTTKENVCTTLEYIRTLPIKLIRGLLLPYDSKGYYVTWPDGKFYKRRNWEGKSRYKGPKGIKPPLFVIPGNKSKLVIVEGELNALSLLQLQPSTDTICSPGAAPELLRVKDFCKTFKTVTIYVDNDGPGVIYGVKLKDELLKLRKRVELIPLDVDFNEQLQRRTNEGS